jgi:hypothetical protein
MRETRAKVSNAITASGFPAPQWPEVGQQVKWTLAQTSLGGGLANLSSHRGGRSSSAASSMALRFQSSISGRIAHSPQRRATNEEVGSSVEQHESPLLDSLRRQREVQRLQLSEYANSSDTILHSPGPGDLSFPVDPSIFNPGIHVVKLPDYSFLRTPPVAPRAMLEDVSSVNRPPQGGRSHRYSDATETSFHSANACWARRYSSSTSDTHNIFEPNVLDSAHDHEYTIVCGGSEVDITEKSLRAPIRARPKASTVADSRQVLDTPRIIRLPTRVAHDKTINQGPTQQPSCWFSEPECDNSYGSWSQSRIWFSKEERLRLNFARMQEKAHHLGLDKSPFLPETVGEYAALLAERKAAEAKRIRKKIQLNEKAAQIRHHEESMVSPRSPLINECQVPIVWRSANGRIRADDTPSAA